LEVEKLRHLLMHWIEHSEEHTRKYEELAEKIKEINPNASEKLKKAVEKFREGEYYLKKAISDLSD